MISFIESLWRRCKSRWVKWMNGSRRNTATAQLNKSILTELGWPLTGSLVATSAWGRFFPVSLPLHTKLGENNHFNAVFTQGERASCGGFFFLFNSGTILIFIQVHLCGSHTNTTHCQSNRESWKNAPSHSPLSKFKKPTECVAHFEFNSKGPWMQSLNEPFVERLCRYFPGPMLKATWRCFDFTPHKVLISVR